MKTAKKKLNVRLLRKIQRHILEEPKRFLMRTFVETGQPGEIFQNDRWEPEKLPACGTAACIGGWACILSGVPKPRNFQASAAKLLGVHFSQRTVTADQSDRLFSVRQWPNKFADPYGRARTPKTRAEIAAARIDHFIATKGAE